MNFGPKVQIFFLIIIVIAFAIYEGFITQTDPREKCPNEIEPDPVFEYFQSNDPTVKEEIFGRGATLLGDRYCSAVKYDSSEAKLSLRQLIRLGANWVEIVATEYQQSETAPSIRADVNKTATLSELNSIFTLAKSRLFKVFFKPQVMVETDGKGKSSDVGKIVTGGFTFESWFRNYRSFIMKYATVAQLGNVDLFAISVNLNVPNTGDEKSWKDLLVDIKNIYSGKIIVVLDSRYSYDKITWLSDSNVDFIGFDTYQDSPVKGINAVKLQDAKDEIKKKLDLFNTFANQINKFFYLTGYGYCSGDCINNPRPKGVFNTSLVDKNNTQYVAVQSNYTLAVIEEAKSLSLSNITSTYRLKGAFLWGWLTDTNFGNQADNNCYSPQGKTTKTTVLNAYKLQSLINLDNSGGNNVCNCTIDY